ncbi:MAG: efflux RND transporter periplasmic adaptor subunit [Planctomycetes bacterium]|nr:efflux RND transporter periplasmic adaptor subunit [Planctomycetota bacterium]
MKEGIKRGIVNFVLLLAAVGGLAALFYFRKEKEAPPPPPPSVRVAKPVVKDVTRYYDFTGNTEAMEFIDVQARVEGFLESIHFKESDLVKKDELLFVIDPTQYDAKRDEAAAKVRAGKAELERAQIDLERVEEAVKTNAVSEREVSTRKAQRDIAAAELKAAEAVLINAETELGYTRVVSPIDGRTSRRLVDLGNLVGATEKTLLTTVVKVAPIYVYFNVSELILLEVLGEKPEQQRNTGRAFYVGLASEKKYSREGVMDYIDNTVDPATGTIKVRGILPNKEDPILPGMFVRVRVPAKIKKGAILVEESALGTEIAGKFLLVVGEGDIVEQRPVTIGMLSGSMRVIEEGITPDEVYIVEGNQQARPGLPVTIDTSEKPKPDKEQAEKTEDKDAAADGMEDKLNKMIEKLNRLEKNLAEMESDGDKTVPEKKGIERPKTKKEMPWDVE